MPEHQTSANWRDHSRCVHCAPICRYWSGPLYAGTGRVPVPVQYRPVAPAPVRYRPVPVLVANWRYHPGAGSVGR